MIPLPMEIIRILPGEPTSTGEKANWPENMGGRIFHSGQTKGEERVHGGIGNIRKTLFMGFIGGERGKTTYIRVDGNGTP